MEKQFLDDLALHRVISFMLIGGYAIRLKFDDDTEQIVDLEPILSGPVFGPLLDEILFQEVQIDPDFGALVWPNGADIDPMVLYDWAAHVDRIVARRAMAATR
jgi:hypothetical protein